MKHKITTEARVPLTHDGEAWSAADQKFGQPLEFGDLFIECVHENDDLPDDCTRAMDDADGTGLDSWELTQLLAKAHGAVLIDARALERLRSWATTSDLNAKEMDRLAAGDSNDEEIEAGQGACDLHQRLVEDLRKLDGFSPRTGPSVQTAYERQGGKS